MLTESGYVAGFGTLDEALYDYISYSNVIDEVPRGRLLSLDRAIARLKELGHHDGKSTSTADFETAIHAFLQCNQLWSNGYYDNDIQDSLFAPSAIPAP